LKTCATKAAAATKLEACTVSLNTESGFPHKWPTPSGRVTGNDQKRPTLQAYGLDS
jgi:hypothetical protein